MKFDQLIGKSAWAAPLQKAWQTGHFPHASLVLGRHGYGSFAQIWALVQWIYCSQKLTDDSCGVCDNCKKVSKLMHPDLHIFFPTAGAEQLVADQLENFRSLCLEKTYFDMSMWMEHIDMPKKKSTKNPNINKLIIKEIDQAFDYKSYLGGERIIIIWGADQLEKSGNKLLKLIEEPPENCFIFLAAESKSRMLPTILSRCQHFQLPAPKRNDLVTYLQSLHKADLDLELIAQIAEDNPVGAEHLIDGRFKKIEVIWLNLLRASFRGRPIDIIPTTNEIASMTKDMHNALIDYALLSCRALLQFKFGRPFDGFEHLKKLADQMRIEEVMRLSDRLNEDAFNLRRNANAKIIFGDLGFYIHELFLDSKNVLS